MAKKTSPILDEGQGTAPEATSVAPKKVEKAPVKKTLKPAQAEKPVAKVSEKPAVEMTEAQKIDEFHRIGRERIEETPKVPFMCPLEPGEKPGAVEVVSLNGYALTIKKGTMVMIPQPLAEILSEKYHVALTAGENMRIDRDEKIENALS